MSIEKWSLLPFTYCVNMEKFLADEFNKYFSRNTYFFVTQVIFSTSTCPHIYATILTHKPLTEKRMQVMINDAKKSGYKICFQDGCCGYYREKINDKYGKKVLLHSTKIAMRKED